MKKVDAAASSRLYDAARTAQEASLREKAPVQVGTQIPADDERETEVRRKLYAGRLPADTARRTAHQLGELLVAIEDCITTATVLEVWLNGQRPRLAHLLAVHRDEALLGAEGRTDKCEAIVRNNEDVIRFRAQLDEIEAQADANAAALRIYTRHHQTVSRLLSTAQATMSGRGMGR